MWNENFQTGISKIDNQHKKLFDTIDVLTIELYNGTIKNELLQILENLGNYVDEHLIAEEALMKKNNYPEYYMHLEAHKQFREMFTLFRNDFEKHGGDLYLGIRLEKELRKWWEEHVMKFDMQYVPYLKITEIID